MVGIEIENISLRLEKSSLKSFFSNLKFFGKNKNKIKIDASSDTTLTKTIPVTASVKFLFINLGSMITKIINLTICSKTLDNV